MRALSMITIRFALLPVLSTLANMAMAENLCLPNEQIIFSCSIKTRIASLCASTPFTKDTGNMQYRFGTRSHIDFQFPPTPSEQGKHFHLSSTSYGGGGETHLSFINGGFEYIIYERTTKSEEDREGVRPTIFSAGVFVRKGSGQTAKYKCSKNESAGINAIVYDALPTESFKPLDLKQ